VSSFAFRETSSLRVSPFLLILNVKTRHPIGNIFAPKILFEMAHRGYLSVAELGDIEWNRGRSSGRTRGRVIASIILTLTVEMSLMSRGIRAAPRREDSFTAGRARCRWRTLTQKVNGGRNGTNYEQTRFLSCETLLRVPFVLFTRHLITWPHNHLPEMSNAAAISSLHGLNTPLTQFALYHPFLCYK